MGSIFLNSLAIILLIKSKSPFNQTIFDKILISHCVVDILTGTIDFALFYISTIFPYWPFNRLTCIFYYSIDNVLATVEILHMIFMSWVRLRSILSPVKFKDDLIVVHWYLFVIIFYILACIFWVPMAVIYISKDRNERVCSFNLNSKLFSGVIVLIGWVVPIIIVLIVSFYMIYFLNKRDKINLTKSSINSTNLKSTKYRKVQLRSQIRLTIIILPFCTQYLQYSLLWLLSIFCARCISNDSLIKSYLFGVSVVITNPLILLIFNYKILLNRK
ncbi:unnamed protein product [Brachionus calyciflorus]|uniref:G-protein coupled receptors family 1 profile domain-containing protein n=1 Tax=Brachionus calyciflorus TaxID=104777 RepID=A0A814P198_9BILA|nr:unnamed protein product [Brachionus calyciflorus]